MSNTFIEVQRFRQWYVIILLVILCLLCIWIFYSGFLVSFLTEGKTEIEVLIFTGLIMGLILFLWSIRLKIILQDKGITIHYFPFYREFHTWEEFESVTVAEYPFVHKGVRWSDELGIVYSLQGHKGVHIRFKNGEMCYVSSLNPDVLLREIEKKVSEKKG